MVKDTIKINEAKLKNENLYVPVEAKGSDKLIYKTRLVIEDEQWKAIGELADKLIAEAYPDADDYLLPREEEAGGKYSILASTIYEPKINNETGLKVADGDTVDAIIKISPALGSYGPYVVYRLVRIDKK